MGEDGTPKQAPTRAALTPEQQAVRQAASHIADTLDEHAPGPRAQIARVVRVLGIERAQAFLEQALAVEQNGGMLLPDGSRRRTPGGVFFKLVRDGVSKRERGASFPQPPVLPTYSIRPIICAENLAKPVENRHNVSESFRTIMVGESKRMSRHSILSCVLYGAYLPCISFQDKRIRPITSAKTHCRLLPIVAR